MSSFPLVSIGLPTRNRCRLLERALGTLHAQDYPNCEIVVADNASDDDTRDVCRRAAHDHPALRYEPVETMLPVFKNFRRALLLCRGQYFMWASDDDLWEPTFVSTLVKVLEEDSELALASAEARYMLVDGTALPVVREGGAFEHPVPGAARERMLHLLRHCYGNLLYGLHRREVLVDEAGATPLDTCSFTNEIPILLHVAARGRIRVLNSVLFHKAVPLAVYQHVARENGCTPEFSDSILAASAPVPRTRGGFRRLLRGLRGAEHGVRAYHRQTRDDVLRALEQMDLDEVTVRDVRREAVRRLRRHSLKLTLLWPLQDALGLGPRTDRHSVTPDEACG